MASIKFRSLTDNVLGQNEFTTQLNDDLSMHVYSFDELVEGDAVNIVTSEAYSGKSVGFGSAFTNETDICFNLAAARIMALDHELGLDIERKFTKE